MASFEEGEKMVIYSKNIPTEYIYSNNQKKCTDKSLSMLIFIGNVLDDGWCVQKKNNDYVFSKKHNGSNTFFSNDYLEQFVQTKINASPKDHT